MAALLHQAALQPPQPSAKPHPWTQSRRAPRPSSTSSLSLPHVALSKRRRAPTPTRQLQLQAAGSGRAIGTPVTDSTSGTSTKAPSKKMSRKEKQRRRRRREEEEEERQLLLLEASLVKDGGGGEEYDDEIPQPVLDRILRRILFTVGVPMASGVGLLNVYDALKRGQGVDVPPWLPLLTILVSFGTSALGIAYGTLSASWDPEKEGSVLGLDEARSNWSVLWKEEIEKAKKKMTAHAWMLDTETLQSAP